MPDAGDRGPGGDSPGVADPDIGRSVVLFDLPGAPIYATRCGHPGRIGASCSKRTDGYSGPGEMGR